VDAKNDRAIAFYKHHGFRALASQPRTMFLPLVTAQKALRKSAALAKTERGERRRAKG
jgi:ribosomal protein S18 acetylase RimI-like enzyme